METLSELIDKLSIVNTKLYNLLDRSVAVVDLLDEVMLPNYISEAQAREMLDLLRDNVALVRQRSRLKKEIDARIDDAIKTGKNDVLLEVKRYG